VDADVLVVGAGPTGLMLANQLLRQGVRPLVVDRHAGPAVETRALGVQARTLEIYRQLGIADEAIALGKRATGANLWAEGRRTARLPLGDIGRDVSPYPYLLILGQDDNERLLGELLRTLGGEVRWRSELVDFTQHDDRVVASVRQPDGTLSEMRCAWIAGCDGAHSAVRKRSGIAFEGAAYEHVFFVADLVCTGPLVPDELNVFLWREGFHLFFPMRGTDHWRLVGILPPGLRGRDDLSFDDVLPSVRGKAALDLRVASCSWYSTYRIHHRCAARFRDARAFLLGDAAHIHSPVGAQGMNTGLQDAYNLAWKLALVIGGRADAALLDSYEAERRPVAQRLVQTTDRAFAIVVADNALAGLLRTRILARVAAFAMSRESVRRLAFRTISQTGIAYPQGPLSQTLAGVPPDAPRAGMRFPWLRWSDDGGTAADVFDRFDGRRFTLVVAGQAVPAGLLRGDLVNVVQVPAEASASAGLAPPSFHLVRPDGYIGLAGRAVDAAAIDRYLSERLRVVAARARGLAFESA
jgi:2-polyprenyl-6-methoxyphenol hydroxylase-like FAD-dependent oxidoreductase